MGKVNPDGRHAPRLRGEIVVAALLAAGAFFEGSARHRRAWLAAVPIAAVNSVAFYGQLAYLNGHLHAPLGIRVLVALTLESIAVYLAWQAHLALIADDSALRLRLAASGFAGGIAVLNYSHYMVPGWHPTATAIIFALCSVSSPGLWSVYSRRQARDQLKARGKIEAHAVRLGSTRWFWHAYRCCRVMFRATWIAETDPARAIALLERPSRWQQRLAAARQARDLIAEAAGRTENASGAPVLPPGQGAGTPLPPPARPRKEPRPGRPRGRRAGRAAAGHPDKTAPAVIDETALLAELISSGKPLPSVRALSLATAGIERSRQVERVLELARARMNGGSHD